MIKILYNLKHYLSVVAIALVLMVLNTSCFGDEPDGCEADIEKAVLHVNQPEKYFFQPTDSMQVVLSTDSVITFAVRGDADVSALSPEFTLPSSPHQVCRLRPDTFRHREY